MNCSEQINELALALSKAQGSMELAKKDTTNTFFKSKYADLSSIIEVSRRPLAENDLAIMQVTRVLDGRTILETKLVHKSGQWQSSEYPVNPVQETPQSLGSALTYSRRYSWQSIIGLGSDDDDGNAASEGPVKPQQRPAERKDAATGKRSSVSPPTPDNRQERPVAAPESERGAIVARTRRDSTITGPVASFVGQEIKTSGGPAVAPQNVIDEMSLVENPWNATVKVKCSLTGRTLLSLSSDELASLYKGLQSVNRPGPQIGYLLKQIESCLSGFPKPEVAK